MENNFQSLWLVALVFSLACALFAWLYALDKKRGKSLLCSLPAIGLLVVVVVRAFDRQARGTQASEIGLLCEEEGEPIPWIANGSLEATDRFSEELIQDAVEIAVRILMSSDLPSNRPLWELESAIRSTCSELPTWIVQRVSGSDMSVHRIEFQFPGNGRIAETSAGSEKKIALYVDRLAVCFQDRKLNTQARRATFLAFTLIHELCHVPRACGGVFEKAVPGDPTDTRKLASLEHIGLHRWMAEIACWFLFHEANTEDERFAAKSCLDGQRAILVPETGAYGLELIRHRNAGSRISSGPAGPDTWHAVGPTAMECP